MSVPGGETRERLLATGEQLFATRGIDAVSVRDITEAAEANTASINYHFGSKLGLIEAIVERRPTRSAGGGGAARRARRHGTLDLRAVTLAMVLPTAELVRDDPSGRYYVSFLVALGDHPELVSTLDAFEPSTERYLRALSVRRRSCPIRCGSCGSRSPRRSPTVCSARPEVRCTCGSNGTVCAPTTRSAAWSTCSSGSLPRRCRCRAEFERGRRAGGAGVGARLGALRRHLGAGRCRRWGRGRRALVRAARRRPRRRRWRRGRDRVALQRRVLQRRVARVRGSPGRRHRSRLGAVGRRGRGFAPVPGPARPRDPAHHHPCHQHPDRRVRRRDRVAALPTAGAVGGFGRDPRVAAHRLPGDLGHHVAGDRRREHRPGDRTCVRRSAHV